MERAFRVTAAVLPATLSSKDAHRSLLLHSRSLTQRGPRLPKFCVQAANTNISSSKTPSPAQNPTQSTSSSLPLPLPKINANLQLNKGVAVVLGATLLGMAVLAVMLKPADRTGGSVEDLVKRGQLRSDRRSSSRPLKYDDPFNNPMVKVGDKNAVVKMNGKAFRIQPVTLTEEKMLNHQNRRVQAYHWKRPTVFLVEGEQIPDGVDPDTVRWIPPNHPFATTKTDFDEVAAEKNVYQTRGAPSRVRAEHEALRKRMMEAAEREPYMQAPVFDPIVKGEKRRAETSFSAFSEQPDSGLGSRPIKPFETPDDEMSTNVQDAYNKPFNPNTD